MIEEEQLQYNDLLVELASLMQQYGTRRVMMDFQTHYPAFFQEMKVQINRFPEKSVAALLRK
ncbi:hypothetical protein UFOVP39_24 [uncultured Caudovirales phage]|uniref:Uncharacterized protein n=1 Tax=uncultured Caudovirales phage TaxID=2100421 RepID=A0A6J5T7J4_9CAUD|nr:hypothetical protein UFOVP39_24 [uncultured Caudovirales phage]